MGTLTKVRSMFTRGGSDDFSNAFGAKSSAKADRIKTYPFVSHFKGSPTASVLRYRNGTLVAASPGQSFYFRKINTEVAEVPLDDQEVQFMFTTRSRDFVDVTVQGIVVYRVVNATETAKRIDFTLDMKDGTYRNKPQVKIESFVTQAAQEATTTYIMNADLEQLMVTGIGDVRDIITAAFNNNPAFTDLGLELASVTVTALKPRADVEKALQTTTLEKLQEVADRATFERRAKAVEKEAQIQANEIANKVAQTKAEANLIDQQAANALRQAEEGARRDRLAAESRAATLAISTAAEADHARTLGEAQAAAEAALYAAITAAGTDVAGVQALRTLAENLNGLTTLTLGSDLLSNIVAQVQAAQPDQ